MTYSFFLMKSLDGFSTVHLTKTRINVKPQNFENTYKKLIRLFIEGILTSNYDILMVKVNYYVLLMSLFILSIVKCVYIYRD